MKAWIGENPMTAMMWTVFVLVAVVGGVLVVVDEAGTLSYEDYLAKLTQFALAVGVLGAGKAIKNGLKNAPPATEDGLPPSDLKEFAATAGPVGYATGSARAGGVVPVAVSGTLMNTGRAYEDQFGPLPDAVVPSPYNADSAAGNPGEDPYLEDAEEALWEAEDAGEGSA